MGKISLGEAAFMAVFFLLYFLLYMFKNNNFGEYYKKFNYSSVIWSRFYLFMIAERWISGLALILAINTHFSIAPALIFALILLIMVVIFKPFIKRNHNIRFCLNMIFTICILVIYMFYSFA